MLMMVDLPTGRANEGDGLAGAIKTDLVDSFSVHR